MGTDTYTPKQRFIRALEGSYTPGLVPHFELVFFLTMEAFGRVHPTQRHYHQWDQMEAKERDLHRRDIADVYVQTARHYGHSGMMLHLPQPLNPLHEEHVQVVEYFRELADQDYFLCRHGDATLGMGNPEELSFRLADEPEKIKDECQRNVDVTLANAERYYRGVYDGFALCTDYCFNHGPFLSPGQFAEFVAPYLKQLIAGYREMGFYTIKHTDGNIMPIVDQLVECNPHALHSLDPQGGVDIAEIKRRYGDRLCLIGNVNCGLLDTGTDEECIASARYALEHGMPGGGYVFATSNSIYTGMKLERYHLILDVWREHGRYD